MHALYALMLPAYAVFMIDSLTGTVAEVGTDFLVLDVGGVGYHLTVLPSVPGTVKTGERLMLLTHLHVREDELSLYGFATDEERRFFRLLLTVPGIGPRTAMSILAVAPPDILVRAVTADDATLLTKVSGIGRKTAERVVTELKARLERDYPTVVGRGATPHGDVIEALVVLGYTRAQAREAARKLPTELTDLENGVRAALQLLGTRAVRQHRASDTE
ncbi:MAG: holliday junction DNA helicase RuvA [Parcubacteria group bacterium Gr01-1014_38]|nr:MAG: holliday junction DNA helicase RuvA [Parcubacteria group bacterium Gr01-1014_38]